MEKLIKRGKKWSVQKKKKNVIHYNVCPNAPNHRFHIVKVPCLECRSSVPVNNHKKKKNYSKGASFYIETSLNGYF